MAKQLLVIEDEPTLLRLLTYNLVKEGYSVVSENQGLTGYDRAIHQPFDLILLDLMLPQMSGLRILTNLRNQGVKTPVIILTAKNDEATVVEGLKLGADDYITKPFGVSELLARVDAVLRRCIHSNELLNAEEQQKCKIILGSLEIHPQKYEVFVANQSITLRRKEFEVLLYLAKKPGVVLTRDDLMNFVWGFDYVGGQRTVDVHVSSLRKKLGLDCKSIHIDSIRGVGYKLVVNGKSARSF